MAELGTVFVDVKGDYNQLEGEAKSKIPGIAVKAAAIFAAAFAAKKIFDFGAAAVREANDLNESANAVAQTFTGTALPAVQALGDTAAQSYGLSTSEFNQMAVQFAGFAEQIDSSDVGGVIDNMSTRVADFASVMNLEVNEAGSEFQSIMAGSSEVARKYGLDVSAAAVEQFAMESGLAASKSEMTESVKVQARYGILMQQTEKWAGDFANTSDQLANSTRIAQAEFSNAKAELGQALLPVLATVVGLARDQLIPVISELSPVFTLVAESISQIAPFVVQLIKKLVPLVGKILPPLIDILTIILDLFFMLAEPILDLIDVALTPIIEIVSLLAGDLAEALKPALMAVAEAVVALTPLIILATDLLKPLFEIVGMVAKILGAGLTVVIKEVTFQISKWIEQIKPIIEWLTNLWDNISDALGSVLPGILQWFKDLPGIIGDAVSGAINWLIDTGKDIVRGLIEGIKSMAGKIVETVKTWIIDKIPGPIKTFFGIASPSRLMMEYGQDIAGGLAVGITGGSNQVDRAINKLLRTPSFTAPSLAGADVSGGGLTQVFQGPVLGSVDDFAVKMSDAWGREMRYRRGG